MCVKQSSLADCSSYINEDWMRNSRVGEAEKKTGTMDAWVTEQIFFFFLNHVFRCRAFICPQDGSVELLLWKRFIQAVTAPTEPLGL